MQTDNNNQTNQECKGKQIIKHDEHGRPFLEISEGFYCRVEYDDLSEEDKQKALDELRETPENVKEGLEKLRELLDADIHLFIPSEFDEFLMKFLRRTKFYPDSAYKLIRSYYKFKIRYPEYGGNLLPANGKLGYIHGIVETQPLRTKTNSRMLILKVGNLWDPSQLTLVDIFRTVQLCLEAAIIEPLTQVNGQVVIIDVDGLSLRHIMQFSPNFAMMFLEWIQECAPLRTKAVHIVYNSTLFEIVFAIFKPFIGTKLRNRIFFHGSNFENLVEAVGAHCLRPRYGGTMPCDVVDGTKLAEMFEESHDEFELVKAFGFVENKNVGMPSVVRVSGDKSAGAKYVLGPVRKAGPELDPK